MSSMRSRRSKAFDGFDMEWDERQQIYVCPLREWEAANRCQAKIQLNGDGFQTIHKHSHTSELLKEFKRLTRANEVDAPTIIKENKKREPKAQFEKEEEETSEQNIKLSNQFIASSTLLENASKASMITWDSGETRQECGFLVTAVDLRGQNVEHKTPTPTENQYEEKDKNEKENPRKRGRPRKYSFTKSTIDNDLAPEIIADLSDVILQKRGRGRPRKYPLNEPTVYNVQEENNELTNVQVEILELGPNENEVKHISNLVPQLAVQKRGRGRPRKNITVDVVEVSLEENTVRGPSSLDSTFSNLSTSDTANESTEMIMVEEQLIGKEENDEMLLVSPQSAPKKRGRPKKLSSPSNSGSSSPSSNKENELRPETKIPRKRGRPRKDQIPADDENPFALFLQRHPLVAEALMSNRDEDVIKTLPFMLDTYLNMSPVVLIKDRIIPQLEQEAEELRKRKENGEDISDRLLHFEDVFRQLYAQIKDV